MPISRSDFEYVRNLVRSATAISLPAGKEYLAETRLVGLAREAGFSSVGDLVAQLRVTQQTPLHRKAVEAITTHETSFFRDQHPFDALKKLVTGELVNGRTSARPVWIWSAACSSGQEPYSIAITIRQAMANLSPGTIRILGSDISSEMLARAKAGRYSQLEIDRGLPGALAHRYFEHRGSDWFARDELRQMVDFQEMNLAAPLPSLPMFDVVFLRNVLIYFEVETKKAVLASIRRVMAPNGLMFLGSAETTVNVDENFERIQIGKAHCYRLRGFEERECNSQNMRSAK